MKRVLELSMERRRVLQRVLLGSTAIGLRALATGIPVSLLLNPREGLADTPATTRPQFLILSTSSKGDPTGCNVPGTYDDAGIVHPSDDPQFAAANITQSGVTRKGAAVWATLPQALLDRTCFFHHGTYTVVHGDNSKTLALDGAVSNLNMFVSMAAAQLAAGLKTVQTEPISLCGESLSVEQQRLLPTLPPKSLAKVLTVPDGPLHNLQALRDQTLDKMNAWMKANNVPSQKNFIDRFATSQTKLRSISSDLFGTLESINDDDVGSQIRAAITLIQMHISPVLAIYIPFGDDNHGDSGLRTEKAATVSGVGLLQSLYTQLQAKGLQDQVSFASVNVFGRSLKLGIGGGRDHNADHHTTIMFGKNIKGGVVGGLIRTSADYGAAPIDSATGKASSSGDITPGLGLASMGKTLCAALGLPSARIDANITKGTTVAAALQS